MSTNIVPFRRRQTEQPIAQFFRVGYSAHTRMSALFAEGVLRPRRVVFDASQVVRQQTFLSDLIQFGSEVTLDTQAAELASLSKFSGSAKSAPWAKLLGDGKPLGPGVYQPGHAKDIYGVIARFAVEHGFHRVLSPSHLLDKRDVSAWLSVDAQSCIELRRALDREGGAHIEIDYPLILQHTLLKRADVRGELLSHLGSLPFQNLWVRAAGFGNDASPSALRNLILSLRLLHNVGSPIVNDYLGGMLGTVALAFGASSGISHGIGERERFDASQWDKPVSAESGGFGRPVRVNVPGLNLSLNRDELNLLLKARGGKSLIACQNRECCPNGSNSMGDNHFRHAAFQSQTHLQELESVPDTNRIEHMLQRHLRDVLRPSASVCRLRLSADAATGVDAKGLMKRLEKNRDKQEHMHRVMLRTQADIGGDTSRSPAVKSSPRSSALISVT